MTKLSPKQQEVLRLMAEGWKLFKGSAGHWLTGPDGIGYLPIRYPTYRRLRDCNLIAPPIPHAYLGDAMTYILTPEGQKIAGELKGA